MPPPWPRTSDDDPETLRGAGSISWPRVPSKSPPQPYDRADVAAAAFATYDRVEVNRHTQAPVPSLALSGVLRGRLDISRNVDGEAVVLACIDLGDEEVRASAHAVGATISERFRVPPISGDDVLELRELTGLADELRQAGPEGAVRTFVFSPARLNLYRDAVAYFVARRDQAEWMREQDREPLARVRPLLPALAELSREALWGALAPVWHGR